jgi:lipoprotein NlpI
MRPLSISLLALSLFPAAAQSHDETWSRCKDLDKADASIDSCTALIESGRESKANLAVALSNRCGSYVNKGQFIRAIADCDEAIRLQPKLAEAWGNRGNAYRSSHEYDHALQDYDHALRLKKDFAGVYNGRGWAYRAQGNLDRAIRDFDQAIRLDPGLKFAFTGRGSVNFIEGRFSQAVVDLQHGVNLGDSQLRVAILLHLARRHAGEDDRQSLLARSAKVHDGQWPAPALKFYMDQLTADQLLAAAANQDPEKDQRQRCEANFYIAEDSLLRQDRARALAGFQTAASVCPQWILTYAAAVAELQRLEKEAISK